MEPLAEVSNVLLEDEPSPSIWRSVLRMVARGLTVVVIGVTRNSREAADGTTLPSGVAEAPGRTFSACCPTNAPFCVAA